jgi:hypothetical protein
MANKESKRFQEVVQAKMKTILERAWKKFSSKHGLRSQQTVRPIGTEDIADSTVAVDSPSFSSVLEDESTISTLCARGKQPLCKEQNALSITDAPQLPQASEIDYSYQEVNRYFSTLGDDFSMSATEPENTESDDWWTLNLQPLENPLGVVSGNMSTTQWNSFPPVNCVCSQSAKCSVANLF